MIKVKSYLYGALCLFSIYKIINLNNKKSNDNIEVSKNDTSNNQDTKE
jgi:hypothetical protein